MVHEPKSQRIYGIDQGLYHGSCGEKKGVENSSPTFYETES